MKIKISKQGMPTTFINRADLKGIEAEALIRVRGPRTPAAMLLIFDKPESMRAFWVSELGHDLPNAVGAVNALNRTVESYKVPGKVKTWMEVDRNLACIIALCRTHINTEIVVHESVHAGFAMAARFVAGIWDDSDNPEEDVCYPAGMIASAINDFLHKKGFYAATQVRPAG